MNLLKYVHAMFISLTLVLPTAVFAKSIPFSIPSKDRLTQITGQIDLPDNDNSKSFPLIVLVGGTHLFDRDYDFGSSDTDKDLLFRELSKNLTTKGFAVARYDYRGIKCNRRTVEPCPNCKTHEEFMTYFAKKCIDNSVRSSVTVQTTRDDIEAVYNFAKSQSFIIPHRSSIVAHSEGTVHTAHLVKDRKIDPKAILFWGFVAESPKEMFKWQWTDRSLSNLLKSYGLKRGDNLTNEAISLQCQKMNIPKTQCDELISPKGYYTSKELEYQVDAQYEVTRSEALSHPETEAFKYVWAEYGVVFSSYNWWQMWFSDEVPNISGIFDFPGKMSFINGTIDMATPSGRELSIVKNNNTKFKNKIHINEVPDVGHGLGPNPANGPISENSMNLLLREVNWLTH